jgi:hypothetical protein
MPIDKFLTGSNKVMTTGSIKVMIHIIWLGTIFYYRNIIKQQLFFSEFYFACS